MAKQSIQQQAFSKMADIAGKALGNVAKQAGSSGDRQQEIFNQLTEQDFQRLANIYGNESVAEYIKTFTIKPHEGEAR